MNSIIISGRLTAKPELRFLKDNTEVTTFSVAVDNGYGESKRTDFFRCTAWRGTAKFLSQYAAKGDKVNIEGSMHCRKWTDDKSVNRDSWEITVTSAELNSSRNAPAADPEQPADFAPVGDEDGELPF